MNDISPWRNRHPTVVEPVEVEDFRSVERQELDLRYYWNVLIKCRRLILLVFLTVLIIGGYSTLTATRLYQASSTLKIEPQNPAVTGVGEMLRLESGAPQYDYYQTQFNLLESSALAAKVITDLKLQSNKIFTGAQVIPANPVSRAKSWILSELAFIVSLVTIQEPETAEETTGNAGVAGNALASNQMQAVEPSLIAQYKGFLRVIPITGTRLVQIAFTTPHPGLSQQLANAHARGFIQLSSEYRFALTKEAHDFLDGKNAELKQKLQQSEDALNRFRQTHGVVSMEKGENIVVDRLVDLNRQLTAARAQRIEAESLYKTVENKSNQSLSQVVTQGMVPALRSNLLMLEADKIKLGSIFKPDH